MSQNIGFAYRTNLDEYRVQIGEKFREQLKSYHLQGGLGFNFRLP